MTVSLKHKFTSAKTDGADTTVVRPSNWNDEHDLTLAASRLLGRATASTGAAEEVTVGTSLDLDAATKTLRRAALTGDVTASVDSNATTIANGAITTAKIAANAVDGTKIALGSDAQGDIMYYNGTDYVRLPAGTSGQYLKTQGAGANPTWASASVTTSDVLTAYSGMTANAIGTHRLVIDTNSNSYTVGTNYAAPQGLTGTWMFLGGGLTGARTTTSMCTTNTTSYYTYLFLRTA